MLSNANKQDNIFNLLEEPKSNFYLDSKSRTYFREKYLPDITKHRSEEIKSILQNMHPAFYGGKCHHMMILGTPGTGKTATILFIKERIENSVSNTEQIKLIYVNCMQDNGSSTEYKMYISLCKELGIDIKIGTNPHEIYIKIKKALNDLNLNVILILDEIDGVIKHSGDNFLYTLSRIDNDLKDNACLSLIGITNDSGIFKDINAKIQSSFSPNMIIFPPYNAVQLRDILLDRSSLALKKDSYSEGFISKCAAYSAQETGDARKALNLFTESIDLAERNGDSLLTEKHLELAQKKIEVDFVMELINRLEGQKQVALYSILRLFAKGQEIILTGDVYDIYIGLIKKIGYRSLDATSISKYINEFESLGFISAKKVSRGKYGHTREIRVLISKRCFDLTMSLFANKFENY